MHFDISTLYTIVLFYMLLRTAMYSTLVLSIVSFGRISIVHTTTKHYALLQKTSDGDTSLEKFKTTLKSIERVDHPKDMRHNESTPCSSRLVLTATVF
jgi:hypothetical protein